MRMTPRERFLAVVQGKTPDYVPIFGFTGAPGMAGGCMKKTYDRLVATGMPAHVGGVWYVGSRLENVEGWHRYWGTTGPLYLDFSVASGAQGFRTTSRIEGEYEIVESENGALTRQVLDNDITYSMPEFIRYPVRDRDSWAFYRQRATPRRFLPPDEVEANCRRFDHRTMPLCVGAGGTYGFLRGLMGPKAVSLAFYDDPALLHEMIAWRRDLVRRSVFPLIERLKPEIVGMGEDLCYNHGMLLSPAHFEEFCAPYYREVCDCARANGAALVAVDTDGNLMEYAGLARACGVNGLYPCEVKAGNDLFALREHHPDLVLFGWLEKEVINEGNEAAIEPEILRKVPPLLAKGRYFPNGDHGIQPLATFSNLCRFQTLLHEVCCNPEGEFPRVRTR